MKNLFVIAVILLFIGASATELFNHNLKLGLFYFLSAAINAVVAFMKG